jgi:hypothetical protein
MGLLGHRQGQGKVELGHLTHFEKTTFSQMSEGVTENDT